MATPTAPSQKTILIVDDQRFFLTVQEGLFKQQGFRVVTAANGTEALARAKQHRPDLILLDVEMPGMDGFAVCQKLKEDQELKQIPVVILTATQDVKLNQKAFKAGAEITVLKTVSGERLLNIVRITLEKGKSPV
jgi:CheY-like chemotaxis protein